MWNLIIKNKFWIFFIKFPQEKTQAKINVLASKRLGLMLWKGLQKIIGQIRPKKLHFYLGHASVFFTIVEVQKRQILKPILHNRLPFTISQIYFQAYQLLKISKRRIGENSKEIHFSSQQSQFRQINLLNKLAQCLSGHHITSFNTLSRKDSILQLQLLLQTAEAHKNAITPWTPTKNCLDSPKREGSAMMMALTIRILDQSQYYYYSRSRIMSNAPNPEVKDQYNRLVFHKIHFTLRKRVNFGQAIYVCGNLEELGSWNPERAFKLKWNEDDIWSSSLLLSKCIPETCEYKYIISDWQQPTTRNTVWEIGQHNRKIDIDKSASLTYCNDRWNMDKISLNIMIPKTKDSQLQKYYVTGQINQLGCWKQRRLMKNIIKKSISFQRKENIYHHIMDDADTSIFTYSFYTYRGREKFKYSYIKKEDVFQGERTPKRVLDLQNQYDFLPNRINIFHPRGEIFVLDQCRISELNYSQITKNIFVGSHIRMRNDLQNLNEKKITTILSIQSQKDFKKNGLSPYYLKLLCDQFGIKYRRYSIQDMNQDDFIIKADGCLKIMHELLSEGGNLYVHCSAGIYRSPQIVALYLAIYQHYSAEDAMNTVKKLHPYAKPSLKAFDGALKLIKLKRYLRKISI